MSIINYLDDMALAIKEKSGYQGKMTYAEMPEKIRELAFEDPMKEYEDNSVLLKKGNLFIGENSNVAILDLGEPEQGKPTYNRFDLHPYYEGEQTSGETVAVINDSGNVYSLNTEIDNINRSSDGSAYTIKYGDENKLIEVVKTDFNSSHGILFDQNGYTCKVPHYNSEETAIVKFDSSGVFCAMINGANGDLFYQYINSSGEKYYGSTDIDGGDTYVLHANDDSSVNQVIDAPNGFAFITSSGANQTYDGYNYIQLFDEKGDQVNPYEIEEGTYSINYNPDNFNWEMHETAPAPVLDLYSVYYYYTSSGEPRYDKLNIQSGEVYSYLGDNDVRHYEINERGEIWITTGDSSTGFGLNKLADELSDGLYYWDGSSSFTWEEGLIYSAGSGSYPRSVELDSDYLYMYNGNDDFIKAEGLWGSGIYYYDGNYNFEAQNLTTYHVYQFGYGCGPELTEISNGIYLYSNGSLANYTNQDGTYLIDNGQFIPVGGDPLTINNLYSYFYDGSMYELSQITLPTQGNPTQFNVNGRTYEITDITPTTV